MKYFDLISELKKNKLIIFSLRDIENLFPRGKLKTLKNDLSRWVKTGQFLKLKRNLYEFVEPGLESNIPDVYVANKIYTPSYVSLEMALSIYGLIPDVAAQVTSLTTQPTREFKNKHGSFFYRSCQKRAFTGYRLMQYEGFKIFIADREKALVDFIYFAVRRADSLDFDEERFSKHILKKLNWAKVLKYAKLFNNKTAAVLRVLKEWTGC
ncbi:MAG: hypothetical protein ISS44_01860 [Candidatus Omnitrophica bacterium]|nr:hypothetical protein [Candidatus Omnitrophota bacterium]